MPQISIITVCRNAEATIADTLESVASQTFRDYEHIVIDGASTDGTVEIVRSHAAGLAFWSSERDGGIADAMNKGVAAASGEYVLFLHADDYLPDRCSLQRCAEHIDGQRDIVVFDIIFETGSKRVRRKTPHPESRLKWKSLPHQGMLCRRALFKTSGLFDTNYKICMDYDWTWRAVQRGASVEYVAEVLAVMRDTGISSQQDWPTLRRRFAEERRVHRQRCRSVMMALAYRLYWSLYLPYRRARSLLGPSSST